jgi:hypothetical protein
MCHRCAPEWVAGGKAHHADLPVIENADIVAIMIDQGQAGFVDPMASAAMGGVGHFLCLGHRIPAWSKRANRQRKANQDDGGSEGEEYSDFYHAIKLLFFAAPGKQCRQGIKTQRKRYNLENHSFVLI